MPVKLEALQMTWWRKSSPLRQNGIGKQRQGTFKVSWICSVENLRLARYRMVKTKLKSMQPWTAHCQRFT
jgi:hypothetical protein